MASMLGSTAVFILYTSLGGQFAVARTDLVQYGAMLVAIPGAALYFALAGAKGLGGLPPEAWSFPLSRDVRAGDGFNNSAAAVAATVLRNLQPGSIVVMHLTGGNTAPLTAEALPRVVDGLRSRGLRLVKLSELLAAS